MVVSIRAFSYMDKMFIAFQILDSCSRPTASSVLVTYSVSQNMRITDSKEREARSLRHHWISKDKIIYLLLLGLEAQLWLVLVVNIAFWTTSKYVQYIVAGAVLSNSRRGAIELKRETLNVDPR